VLGLAYQTCDGEGSWANKTDYGECSLFLVSKKGEGRRRYHFLFPACQNEIFSEEETRRKVRHAVSVITFGLCLASAVLLLLALGIFAFFA